MLFRPEPAVRAIYLTFTKFEINEHQMDKLQEKRELDQIKGSEPSLQDLDQNSEELTVDVLFGQTVRGQRILSYALSAKTMEVPELNKPILVGNDLFGSQGSVVVHLQISSDDFDVKLVQFNYTSDTNCPPATKEDEHNPRRHTHLHSFSRHLVTLVQKYPCTHPYTCSNTCP